MKSPHVRLLWRALWAGVCFIQLSVLATYFWLLQDPTLDSVIFLAHEDVPEKIPLLLEVDSKVERPDADLVENLRLLRLESQVQNKAPKGAKVVSCRWYLRAGDTGSTSPVALHQSCLTEGAKLVAYNQASYERRWCGQILPPRGVATVSFMPSCREEPAHILPASLTPSANARGMPTIQISGNPQGEGRVEPFPDCDVPCEKVAFPHSLLKDLYIVGTNWRFLFSMEGSAYYPQLKVDSDAHLHNKFFAITSFQAEVPVPYFSWAEYNISNPQVDFDNVIVGASFLARNCNSKNERERRVTELMKYIRVDSLSACMNNAKPPKGLGLQDKVAIQKEYLLHLAFENSNENDYITEKMFGTLHSGSLPVYFGAPNIAEHVPPRSFISARDFDTSEQLGLYLQQVMSNKTLYESYFEWKTKPLPEYFVRRYNFTHTHSTCRICRWSYSKMWGLGWDHETQTVHDLGSARKLRVDREAGLVDTPFRESWLTMENHRDPAQIRPVSSLVATVADSWIRSIFEHDGVIDLHFEREARGKSLLYRMETIIKGPIVQSTADGIMWQDDRTRITIVTSWEASLELKDDNGTVEIVFHDGTPSLARIRVIVEAVDLFHKTGKNRTYYFGERMTRDFRQPVELFFVEDPSTKAK